MTSNEKLEKFAEQLNPADAEVIYSNFAKIVASLEAYRQPYPPDKVSPTQ